jgi:hypothetical protein
VAQLPPQQSLEQLSQAHSPPSPHAQPLASQAQSSHVQLSPQQEQAVPSAGVSKAPMAMGAAMRTPMTARTSKALLSIVILQISLSFGFELGFRIEDQLRQTHSAAWRRLERSGGRSPGHDRSIPGLGGGDSTPVGAGGAVFARPRSLDSATTPTWVVGWSEHPHGDRQSQAAAPSPQHEVVSG